MPEGELRFDEILLEGVMKALGRDPLSAERYVEANAQRLWNKTCALATDIVADGMCPLLDVTDPGARRAIWRPSVIGHSGRACRILARSRARSNILREIDSLTDREYEALGCLVASYSGADRVHLTPPGGEGGVDFLAQLVLPVQAHPFLGLAAPMRIVGQAKMYADPVSVDRIREFVATIQAVCHQSPQVEVHVPPWFRTAKGPVVGWIIGHSGFQQGARQLAKNFGVICSESFELAEICSQSRRIDESMSPAERAQELAKRTRALLQELGA